MRRTILLLAALIALAVPATAHAVLGDLQFVACAQGPGATDVGCPTSPVRIGGPPVFSPDGTQAYTYNNGVLARYAVNADGTLTYLDCIGYTGTTTCATTAPGISNAGNTSMAITPDGDELYALGSPHLGEASLIHFNRAPNGTLTFGSCISQVAAQLGCATTQTHFSSPWGLRMSPDGQDLYIGSDGVLHYDIDASPAGTPQYVQCYGAASQGCVPTSQEAASNSTITLAANGADLYAGAGFAMHHFKRAANGALTHQGCIAASSPGYPGCGTALATLVGSTFNGAAVSADGASFYSGATVPSNRAGVQVFDRAPNGAITGDGCLGNYGGTTCPAFRGLGNVRSVVVAPGDQWVYAYGEGVSLLRRGAGGALTRIGCIQGPAERAGCTRGARGLDDGGQLVVGPGGTYLYAGGFGSLAVFKIVDYVPPPPLDPAPLDETAGTRRAAPPAVSAPDAAPARPSLGPPAKPAVRVRAGSARVAARARWARCVSRRVRRTTAHGRVRVRRVCRAPGTALRVRVSSR